MPEAITTEQSRTASMRSRVFGDWSGWGYVAGIACIVVGILAIAEPPLATLAATFYLGAMLSVAGLFMLVGGLAGMANLGGWLGTILGIFSVLAGLTIIEDPFASAILVIWAIGAWFIIGGILELAIGSTIAVGRRWLLVVAFINIALGIWLLMMDRVQAVHFVGYLVGISLIFRGSWSLLFTSQRRGPSFNSPSCD